MLACQDLITGFDIESVLLFTKPLACVICIGRGSF
jgi:hypothetical protein